MTRTTKVSVVAIVIIVGGFGIWRYGRASLVASENPFIAFWNDIRSPLAFNNPGQNIPLGVSSSSIALYQPDDSYEADVVAAVQKASPAVVSITISENVPIIENCPISPFDFNGLDPQFQQFFDDSVPTSTPCNTGQTQLQQVGGGSGFIISSDGLILTNKHVVSDPSASYSVLTNDGKTYTAKVLARDPNQDLAIVKIDATGLPTVSIGDSSGLQLGQTAIAIGNALGEYSNTVSVGVISGLARTVTASAPDSNSQETIQGVIQTDAAINPGNSGGPLLNLRGQVVGINTAVASDAENIGFAIPINQAKSVISSVESTGQIQVPFLGVQYIDVTPAIATAQKLAVNYGALVRGSSSGPAVEPNSPAAAAGIQAEDIITAIDGQQINSNNLLGDVISDYAVGDKITLTINRAGKTITLQATLTERPAGE